MEELKLIALDAEDLTVLSAHLQDAVVKVTDIAYLPREKRFAALLNRFDWQQADGAAASSRSGNTYVRRRSAFRLEQVEAAQVQGLDLTDKERVLNLLALHFEPGGPEDPAGHVTIIFAGGSAIRLKVAYIEAELRDLGGAWTTKSRPEHAGDE